MTEPTLLILEDGELRQCGPHKTDVKPRFASGNTPKNQHMFGLRPDASEPLAMESAEASVELHPITLRVADDNARAIATYQKVGFGHEKVERQAALLGGTWHDDIMIGLLVPQYRGAPA